MNSPNSSTASQIDDLLGEGRRPQPTEPRLNPPPVRQGTSAYWAAKVDEHPSWLRDNAGLRHRLPGQHQVRGQAERVAETRRFFRRHRCRPGIVRGYFGGPRAHSALDENPMSF
ncbi:hypothetical protein ACFPN0_11330 [Kitasatospora cinereorecta]